MKEFIKRYVIFLVYSGTVSKNVVNDNLKSIKELLIDTEAKIEHSKYVGIKPLAYSIQKNNLAHYVQLYIHLPENDQLGYNLKQIQRKLRLQTHIIRVLLLKVDHQDVCTESLENFEGFNFKLGSTGSKTNIT